VFHVLVLGNTSDEEEEQNACDDAFPQSIRDQVPHFVVKQVELLKSLQIINPHGSVGNGPESQVVHVSEHSPVMSEGYLHTWLKELVFVTRLPITSRNPAEVSELLLVGLQEVNLVHFINYIIRSFIN
jgi:hypothetical protein